MAAKKEKKTGFVILANDEYLTNSDGEILLSNEEEVEAVIETTAREEWHDSGDGYLEAHHVIVLTVTDAHRLKPKVGRRFNWNKEEI